MARKLGCLPREQAILRALPVRRQCWLTSSGASPFSAPWPILSSKPSTAEEAAFEAFARSRPEGLILLIDTYDTEAAAQKVVRLATRLEADGIKISGVRLDSGDLIALSKSVRRIFDRGGHPEISIFASGGIDEALLAAIHASAAPIDGFGIGTSLTTSSDVPALDCAYKLQEYAGVPRRKHSPGKATWPGRKQVWRHYGADGRMAGDTISLESEELARRSLDAACDARGPENCPFPFSSRHKSARGTRPRTAARTFAPPRSRSSLSSHDWRAAASPCGNG